VANLAVQAGDLLAFYGQGIPVDTDGATDVLHYPAVQPLQDTDIILGSADYPVFPQARTYSFGAQVIDLSGQNTVITGGMRKFVDGLPGLNAANNLGQQIPVAVPDTTTYPGSDYYIIELGEYTEQMHSDLPPTTLRGYRQAGGEFHYLGPAIVAQKNRPVRILFRNLLPTGAGGNLFIPVDTTVMGSGMTATGHEMMDPMMVNPQIPMCNEPNPMMKAMMVADGLCYAENRATLHLHGGISPWISDGTPHQWITPAGENTPYPEGVSVADVPDMPTPTTRRNDLLLHQPAERPLDVLPRPCLGHHPPERVCWRSCSIYHPGPDRAGSGRRWDHPRPRSHHPAGRPGQDLRAER
jgi:hypothetical protein